MPNQTRTLDGPFADNLRTALEHAGMPQEALARKVGVSLRMVQKWCAGLAEPRGRRVMLIAELLHKRPEWFYAENGNGRKAA